VLTALWIKNNYLIISYCKCGVNTQGGISFRVNTMLTLSVFLEANINQIQNHPSLLPKATQTLSLVSNKNRSITQTNFAKHAVLKNVHLNTENANTSPI